MSAPTVIEQLRARASDYRRLAAQNETYQGRRLDNDTANHLDWQANELELREMNVGGHELEMRELAEFAAACALERAIREVGLRERLGSGLDRMAATLSGAA